MNPVVLLRDDHRAVKELFRKFERASETSEKQKLGEQIIEELSVHATLEEQLVYPLLRERDAGLAEDVLDALEEHHAVKLTLAELDEMRAEDERYDAKMHVVTEAVELHIQEEERELLPRLEQLLDDEAREKLAAALTALKRTAPHHPHPMAPDTPPGGLVAGVLAKLTDVGKDLARRLTNRNKAEGHERVRERDQTATRRSPRPRTRKATKAKTAAKSPRRRSHGKRRAS